MASDLDPWEQKFAPHVKSRLSNGNGNHAGILLPTIPSRADWEDFCRAVKREWPSWYDHLNFNPACLVVLYCGLGFFEYEDGSFWPEFSGTVGAQGLPPATQSKINEGFGHCAEHLHLHLRRHATSTDYVGSAIYYAGIPVAVWGEFLGICYWALWNPGWENTSEEDWAALADKCCGGHQRLKHFLVSNRELATTFIREMHGLRERIASETTGSYDDLIKNSLIRQEYLEDVPETAEFLMPRHPERLVRERVSLAFNKRDSTIDLRVPATDQAKLPAIWSAGEIQKAAERYPGKLTLNSAAFQRRISVKLASEADGTVDRRSLAGLDSWGLFDMDDGGAWVNHNRASLPTRRYSLVSRFPVEQPKRDGFYEDGLALNDQFDLSDGTRCFLTDLDPLAERAAISFRTPEGDQVRIRFTPRERIEYHLLPGGSTSCFRREGEVLITQSLPTPCVSVPSGYLGGRNTYKVLKCEFKVTLAGKSTFGKWQSFLVNGSDSEYFHWEWDSDHPVMEKQKSGVVGSFQDLYHIPDLTGSLRVSVTSPEFSQSWEIRREKPRKAVEHAWSNLPGAFLPMTLLSQSSRGMTWDEIVLARNAILPGCRMERNTLYTYQAQGFVKQSGARWSIALSRAVIMEQPEEKVRVDYCGDSGKIWGLYCCLNDSGCAYLLPQVEVVAGTVVQPPFLRMIWPIRLLAKVESYLRDAGAEIGESLWTR